MQSHTSTTPYNSRWTLDWRLPSISSFHCAILHQSLLQISIMTTTNTDAALQEAVAAINDQKHCFDVTIICTTDDFQSAYWMELLEQGLLQGRKVLAVSEDWASPGGAGNGLGTLYAYQKACKLAAQKYDNFNLAQALADGSVSAALYHTAGKGTRMAPLPASENNNKPGVKLPFAVQDGDSVRSVSVLEAVIRQTGLYARRGRLSVFWGDQVFLPTASFQQPSTHHADILCTLLGDTAPTAEEWTAQGLDKYGVIAVVGEDAAGAKPLEAAQVEKVSHATATEMLGALGKIQQVGPSLGSFSVSAQFLQALCTEFAAELASKTAKLDTDPHFWMPLTLPEASYVYLMNQKGTSEAESKAHYARMQTMKAKFLEATKDDKMGLFGAVNVGKDACWWDYGQLKLYSANCKLLLETTPQAELLRQFFGLPAATHQLDSTVKAEVDGVSYIFKSKLGGGSVKESLVANVAAASVEADGAIIVNCASPKSIQAGKGAILYNLIDESGDGIVVGPGEVIVGVTDESGITTRLKSRSDIDGGKAWKKVLEMNNVSFEDVHKKNKNANIGVIAKQRQEKFDKVAALL